MERTTLLIRLASHSEDHRGQAPDPGLGSRAGGDPEYKQTSIMRQRGWEGVEVPL